MKPTPWTLLPLLASILLAGAVQAAPADRPPNIVFILIDDMGWKDISANGSTYYRTPNIDKLADDGVRFTQAYAACAVCSPSRAAIMTGKSPARLRITDWIGGETPAASARFNLPKWCKELPTTETTLPELLKARGYATGIVGKWHLGKASPLRHGFDSSIAAGHIGHPSSFFWPYGNPGATHRVPDLAEAGGKKGEYLTDRLTDEAVRFIEKNKDKPFFLYLSHYAVHDPIQAKESDIAPFRDAKPDGRQSFPVYAGMVKSVDDSVGRIRETLARLGLTGNTVLVFTSDNGGAVHFRATDVSPLRAGKGFPYEGGLRVPLIVAAPGITPKGKVSDTPVIGTDFLPTLAHIAGVSAPLPRDLDGTDILPALKGGKLPDRDLAWHYPHYWGGGLITPYTVLRHGNWKLVRWNEFDSGELYDLAADPSENSDRATTESAKVSELSRLMDAWLKATKAQAPVQKPKAQPAKPASANKAHAPKFRAFDAS